MATGKRYYWLKLRESFMASDTVDFLMSRKDGANYVVLYLMLCMKTINTGGRLSRTVGEVVIPFDVDKLRRDCKWFTPDTIRAGLDLYRRFGLIREDADGTLALAEYDSMVGSETDWAEKNRRMRAKAADNGHNVSGAVPTEIRDKEIRDKEIEEEDVCAEPPDAGRSTPAPTPSEFDIPLNDGSAYNVPRENIALYKRLYPSVDVEQALRNMIGWCVGNPTRLKTRRGIKRFITGWLAGDQDGGKTRRSGPPKPYADEDDFY